MILILYVTWCCILMFIAGCKTRKYSSDLSTEALWLIFISIEFSPDHVHFFMY